MTKEPYYLVRLSHVYYDGPQVSVEVLNIDVNCDADRIWLPYAESECKDDIEKILYIDEDDDSPHAEDWPAGLYSLDVEEEILMPIVAQGADRRE